MDNHGLQDSSLSTSLQGIQERLALGGLAVVRLGMHEDIRVNERLSHSDGHSYFHACA